MQCYKIEILGTADNDLDDMLVVLAEYSESAALRKYDKIMDSIAKLRDFPLMCEAYRLRKKYRRMVVEDYIVFYTVNELQKLVRIYRVLCARRDIQKLIK